MSLTSSVTRAVTISSEVLIISPGRTNVLGGYYGLRRRVRLRRHFIVKLQSHFPGCVPGWATDCDPGPSGGGPGYFVVFWRFSHTSPDESRTSHGLRPSDQANRPCRTMQDEPRMSPDDPELATDLPWFTHGRATDDHGWPRMSHGRAPNIPDEPRTSHGQARMSHGLTSSPDRPGCFKHFKTSGVDPGSPRIAPGCTRTSHGPATDPQGRARDGPGCPRIANRGSSGGQIRGSVTVALTR